MSKANRVKRESKKLMNVISPPSDIKQYRQFKVRPIELLNDKQEDFFEHLSFHTMVLGIGPAGTGKTYLSGAVAGDSFRNKQINKIILTRPAVEVGKSMGALPGDLKEKYEPYLAPFHQSLNDRIGKKEVEYHLHKNIIAETLQFMRGKTFDDGYILLDEAQNTTVEEMKMIVTRVGTNSKIFITGDLKQSDIKGENGLAWLVRQIRVRNLKWPIVEFSLDDCVRSGFCREALEMIENEV